MLNEKRVMSILSYMMAVIFGVFLGFVLLGPRQKPVEIFVFFVLLGAMVGVILGKKWAPKLLRAGCIGGIVYFAIKQVLFYQGVDITSMALLGILGLTAYFYRDENLAMLLGPQGKDGKKWTVLVVDDDLTFVKLVKSHFVKQGLTVISSDSGERGLEMAKRWKPDLIILDVILPGMKGRAVCAKLKEDPQTEGIPVMFVTFKNSLDDISAEIELGAVMHLTKPVNYDHLYEQAYKILSKNR